MTDTWFTPEQLTDIENCSKRTIERKIAAGEYKTVKYLTGPKIKGRGGRQILVAFSCLSDKARAAYYKRMQDGETSEPAVEHQKDTGFVSTGHSAPLTTGAIVCPGLAGWQNRIAGARFDLVMDYIKVKEEIKKKKRRILRKTAGRRGGTRPKYSVCAASKDFIAAYNTGITHPLVFKVVGKVAKNTLEKWTLALKRAKWDFAALAPRYGDHCRGRRKVTDAEMEQMLAFALNQNRLRPSQVVRWTKKVLGKKGVASPSSGATLRRALLDWKLTNFDLWVSRRKGEKALDDECLPYIERDSSQLSVGDVLVADGHKLNFQVINPFTGKPGRATWLVFYDWASRYPAGEYIMFSENIQCIHAALRRAILNLGKIPTYVHLDNGKAFKAKIFNDKSLDFEQAGLRGLYARLGIKTHFAVPYNAKDKPVERFFGTFNELERLLPSYIGASIKDKPAYMRRNEKLAKRLHNPFVPTIEQAQTIIRAWIDGEYATREHRGLNGARPIDIWEPGRGEGVEEEGLWYLMMTHEIKTVHRNGVHIFGVNYYDEALYGYRKPVLVKYDILNMEDILVYTQDSREFLCRATPVQKVHPLAKLTGNPLDFEAIKEGVRLKRKLKKRTEASARQAAAEIAPWNFPELQSEPEPAMTRAEIEHVEAQAAETKVISLAEKREPDMALWQGDAYESLLEKRARGGELSDDETIMMQAFETTNQYRMLLEYYKRKEEDCFTTEVEV